MTNLAKARQLLAEAGYPNGFETTLSFDLGFADRQRTAVRARAGEPRPDRHQDDDRQDSRRQLAHGIQQEDDAALHQRLLRLARLSRIFFLLVLRRTEFRVQHDELPEPTDGQADRGRTAARRRSATRRITTATSAALSSSRSTTCRASRSSSPTSTSRCRRMSPATNIGSIDDSITAPSSKRRAMEARGYRYNHDGRNGYRPLRRRGWHRNVDWTAAC